VQGVRQTLFYSLRDEGSKMGAVIDRRVFWKVVPGVLLLIFTLSGGVCLSAESGGKPEQNEILAIGTATIVGENLAQAKDRAISQALVKGVETYLLRRLGRQSAVNNFQRLVQGIIPGAKEEIENFNILTEERVEGLYTLLVRIRINEKVLNEKLREAGVVLAEIPQLKVLFLVSKRLKGGVSYWWKEPEVSSALSPAEVVLHQVFQERGFQPINRTSSVPETEYSEAMRSAELQESDILNWGSLFGADVVIYGQEQGVGEKEIGIGLEAFHVKYGARICRAERTEPIPEEAGNNEGMMKSLSHAVSGLAAEMTPPIIKFALSGGEKTEQFAMTLKGLKSYRQFKDFKDFLQRDVSGVQSVRQTRAGKESTTLAIEFRGDRDGFVRRLLNHENLPFSLSILEMGEEIVLRIE
jgi:hypothetical protein